MKRCTKCNRTYGDLLSFCLEDGTVLSSEQDTDKTLLLPQSQTLDLPDALAKLPGSRPRSPLIYAIILPVGIILFLTFAFVSYIWLSSAIQAKHDEVVVADGWKKIEIPIGKRFLPKPLDGEIEMRSPAGRVVSIDTDGVMWEDRPDGKHVVEQFGDMPVVYVRAKQGKVRIRVEFADL